MKDVLNMIRFDYVAVRRLTAIYVFGFLGVCLVLALFGIPLGIFGFAAALCLFAPVGVMSDPGTCRLYGMLPVSRAAVLRAGFAEIMGTLLAGELLSVLCMVISRVTTLYKLLPERLYEFVTMPFNSDTGLSFVQQLFMMLLIFALLFLLAVYLKMAAEIHGQDAAVRHLFVIAAVLIALVMLGIGMNSGERLSLQGLLPDTAVGLVLFALLMNPAVVGIGAFCCEHTIKKTQNREL